MGVSELCEGCYAKVDHDLIGCPRCGVLCCFTTWDACPNCSGYRALCDGGCDDNGQHYAGSWMSATPIEVPSVAAVAAARAANEDPKAALIEVIGMYRLLNPGAPNDVLAEMAEAVIMVNTMIADP